MIALAVFSTVEKNKADSNGDWICTVQALRYINIEGWLAQQIKVLELACPQWSFGYADIGILDSNSGSCIDINKEYWYLIKDICTMKLTIIKIDSRKNILVAK